MISHPQHSVAQPFGSMLGDLFLVMNSSLFNCCLVFHGENTTQCFCLLFCKAFKFPVFHYCQLALMNTVVPFLLGRMYLNDSGDKPRNGITGSKSKHVFNLMRYCQITL